MKQFEAPNDRSALQVCIDGKHITAIYRRLARDPRDDSEQIKAENQIIDLIVEASKNPEKIYTPPELEVRV
jgi:hypothetical protein